MRLISQLLIISAYFLQNNAIERQCGTDPANLWLDMVIVVDTSKHMTNENLKLISASITELFGQKTRIGTNYTDPRSTRVGLVTYNRKANIEADLDKFNSFQSLYSTVEEALSPTDNEASYLSLGLSKASEVLAAGRSKGYRNNYPQYIVVFAADYQGVENLDPLSVYRSLEAKGVVISVVNMNEGSHDDKWVELTRPDSEGFAGPNHPHKPSSKPVNFNYQKSSRNMAERIMSNMFQTNCVCPGSWSNKDFYHKKPFCIGAGTKKTSWVGAMAECQKVHPKAHLLLDQDWQKRHHVTDYLKSQNAPNGWYHVGLKYENGDWYYQDPNAKCKKTLVETIGMYSSHWKSGFPIAKEIKTGVDFIYENGKSLGWG